MLLALTATASFIMAFTDSYTDPDTKTTFYGVITPKGLCSPTISHVVKARDDPEANGQPLLGDGLRARLAAARDSQLYKPQFGDFAHAMVTCAYELSACPVITLGCETIRSMRHCHAVIAIMSQPFLLAYPVCVHLHACTHISNMEFCLWCASFSLSMTLQ